MLYQAFQSVGMLIVQSAQQQLFRVFVDNAQMSEAQGSFEW